MSEDEVTIVPRTRSKKEEELIKYARDLVTLLEDDKQHSPNEIYIIIQKITKVLGPSINLIPTDLKKGLGVAYACALAETDTATKAAYTRSSLSLLRSCISISHGPREQIKNTDFYINIMGEEIKKVELAGDEAMLDGLWLKTNRAIDYITLQIFTNGYGEINSKGFNFTKSDTTNKETK